MSIVLDILELLLFSKGDIYDLRRELLRGTSNFIKPETLRVTIQRLKKDGFIENSKSGWKITKIGKLKINKKVSKKSILEVENKPNSILISFDIPESKRSHRNWLRAQLISLGFEMIQKSLWFGPPIPKEFLETLHNTNMLKYIRFFHATEKQTRQMFIKK